MLRTKVIYNLSAYGYKPTDTLFRLNLVGENDSKTKCQTSRHTWIVLNWHACSIVWSRHFIHRRHWSQLWSINGLKIKSTSSEDNYLLCGLCGTERRTYNHLIVDRLYTVDLNERLYRPVKLLPLLIIRVVASQAYYPYFIKVEWLFSIVLLLYNETQYK